MGTTTVWNEHNPGEKEPLARLTELADVVMEAAQLLQATAAVAARREETAVPASRGELTGALIADLLANEALDGREVSRRAADLGCDLSLGALVLCIELRVRRPAFVVALIVEGCEAALTGTTARDRVYAILPCVGSCIAGSAGAVRQLADRLSPYGIVGVSSYEADTSQLGRALREAELVLELIRNSGEPVVEDIGRGTYRLLLRMLASNPAEIRDFYLSTVAPIVEYDRRSGTELVTTLRAYLDADCNMNVTAATVDAHRHTIAARLERIHELTGLDPLHYEGREQLGLGLKAYRLMEHQLAVGPV